MQKIVFLMPHDGIVSSGGYKVVYEYANRFAKDGFSVSIVYPNTKRSHSVTLKSKLRDFARYVVRSINKGYRSKWFNLDKRIRLKWVWSLDSYRAYKDTCIIATAVETAYSLKDFPSYIRKFYFIQGYENWFFSDQKVLASYSFPMTKIVIARWLQRIVFPYDSEVRLVQNGFDFNSFSCIKSLKDRNKYSVICMYHIDELKGLDVTFRAFERVYSILPQIKVTFFSVYDKPNNLPKYCSFIKQPKISTLNDLYNEAAIYVGGSYEEGWGLTVGEAMQCGCAVVCTENKGYLEMAHNGETALTSPVGDDLALANNIIRLINDNDLRIKIAKNGESFIHNFDINKSYNSFKSIITKGS
mgnify:FL=1